MTHLVLALCGGECGIPLPSPLRIVRSSRYTHRFIPSHGLLLHRFARKSSVRIPRQLMDNEKIHVSIRHMDFSICGGGGIRTHGTFRHACFQDKSIRPLWHSSVFCGQIESIRNALSHDNLDKVVPNYQDRYCSYLY